MYIVSRRIFRVAKNIKTFIVYIIIILSEEKDLGGELESGGCSTTTPCS